MSGFLAHLTAQPALWRARPPSGRFIMHRIPYDRHCPKHGRVTRYHSCVVTHPAFWGEPLVATSEWIGKVPTGPATDKGTGS